MWTKAVGIVLCLTLSAHAFYQSSDVIELSEAEFNKQVNYNIYNVQIGDLN